MDFGEMVEGRDEFHNQGKEDCCENVKLFKLQCSYCKRPASIEIEYICTGETVYTCSYEGCKQKGYIELGVWGK